MDWGLEEQADPSCKESGTQTHIDAGETWEWHKLHFSIIDQRLLQKALLHHHAVCANTSYPPLGVLNKLSFRNQTLYLSHSSITTGYCSAMN